MVLCGGVVSPITTLIVESALASNPTATSLSSDASLAAVSKIITSLGLTGYDPIDLATANYVAAAKADTAAVSIDTAPPAASPTLVAYTSAITATSNESLFATNVDASSFTLAKSGSVDGMVTLDGATKVATFTPSSKLAILANYSATLSTAITDLSGNGLTTDYNWSFTTSEGAWVWLRGLRLTIRRGMMDNPSKLGSISAETPSRCRLSLMARKKVYGPTAITQQRGCGVQQRRR